MFSGPGSVIFGPLENHPVILCIETSSPVCSVALSTGSGFHVSRESHEPNSHGKVLTLLIEEILELAGLKAKDLDAVAVSAGPGSYTGLRIGMATAKGLCYALDRPLLAVSTTEAMCTRFLSTQVLGEKDLLLPMIDARRMEVFTRIFDAKGKAVSEPLNYISGDTGLVPDGFSGALHLFGSGAAKMEEGLSHYSVKIYPESFIHAENLLSLAFSRFSENRFDPLAYTVPFYGKEWQGG